MTDEQIAVVVLAAGLGKRMQSDLPKVTVATSKQPMICHVLDAVKAIEPQKTVLVTGYRREYVEEVVRSHDFPHEISFAVQETQDGTGHAVKCSEPNLNDFTGTVVILYGDVPLISSETLREFLQSHRSQNATLSIIAATLADPASLGRIVRHPDGSFDRIVEARDCTAEQRAIKEINSGIYAVDSAFLWPALKGLTNQNAQGEYYLTDIAETASKEGQTVNVWNLSRTEEILGVNSKVELAIVNQVLRRRAIELLLAQGVELEDPESIYLSGDVTIEPGARLGPQVKLEGKVKIESQAVLEGNAFIRDSHIGANTLVKWGVRAENAYIGQNCQVGPFAHLRPGAELQDKVKIGNFVEIKNASLGEGAAASHLTYLGDAEIGPKANIGAGTITCNYDGTNKHRTIIGNNVFVGSNSTLIAPITLGDGAYVGAGSTLSKDVPPLALALTRPELKVKPNYQRKKKLD
jgi:bifunctional UDP-N-acetylglucosamine pyrophosphorylase/glucosamine-1-phosphate N-acetyltransferase